MWRTEAGRIVGETDRLRIVIDEATGGIAHLSNIVTGQAMVDGDPAVPWKLRPLGPAGDILSPVDRRPSLSMTTIEPGTCSSTVDDDGVALRWMTTAEGVAVEADICFGVEDDLEFRARVVVDAETEPPQDFTYPIFGGVRPLSDGGADDILVFPAHSGWLIRRPLQQWGLNAHYPDGYSGASMQFMGYIEAGVGGFQIAAHDPHSTWKVFAFGTETSIRHDNWDLRAGTSMELGYPVVVSPLVRGDWFECSQRYRRWVDADAPWAAGAKRDGAGARWLHDEVGISIWCTPSSLDWSRWYRFYEDELGKPLHIVPHWDWPATRPHTVGKEGWFPARFHEANLACWDGHYVTPYMNDWFISPLAENFIEEWEPEVVQPYRFFTFTVFSDPASGQVQTDYPSTDPRVATDLPFYLCPHSAKQRDLHAWRDLGLVKDYGLDGSFYDISSGNPMLFARCLRRDHDHPPGRGRHLVQALEAVNRASKDHVRDETGKYLVQGTETIIENIIGSVDFYVSRAVAGPMGWLESEMFGPEAPPGEGRELIPLFQSVYHDIGPVHEDGWIRLIEEEGDLFYWVAARLYLNWGGLMSIHYPIDPPERPPGYEGGAESIGWGGQHLRWDDLPELDRNKSAYIRRLGQARTTFANAYLGYGRMLRTIPLHCDTIDLTFDQTIPGSTSALRNSGTWTVPVITHGAWLDEATGRVGLLFTNLHATETRTVTLDGDVAGLWGLDHAGSTVSLGSEVLATVAPDNTFTVDVAVPPRDVVLIEIG